MAIKNKDGTIFKLRGPNPLMANQDYWNLDEIILHNMSWMPITYLGNHTHLRIEKPINTENHPIEPPEIRKAESIIETKENPENFFIIKCLPGKINKVNSTIEYGQPYSFEAGLIDDTDLEIILWTLREGIEDGSILFIKDIGRWWRVKSTIPKGKGWIIRAILSDEQPNFVENHDEATRLEHSI